MLVDLAVASGVIAQPAAPCAHAADTTDEKRLWTKVLELDHEREPVHGSAAALCSAIRKGADLRIAKGQNSPPNHKCQPALNLWVYVGRIFPPVDRQSPPIDAQGFAPVFCIGES